MVCHWNAFRSTEGIPLDSGPLTVENNPLMTSLISRTAVHVVFLDFEAHARRSCALDTARKVTGFVFMERGARSSARHAGPGGDMNVHNCLVGCHAGVWTWFTVLAAVQREMISSTLRGARTLAFVTDRGYQRYAPHLTGMILPFKRATERPAGIFSSRFRSRRHRLPPLLQSWVVAETVLVRGTSRPTAQANGWSSSRA